MDALHLTQYSRNSSSTRQREETPKERSSWALQSYRAAPDLRAGGDGAGSEALLHKPNAGWMSAALFRIPELRETLQVGTG